MLVFCRSSLHEYVPNDLIKSQSVFDWKRMITLEYMEDEDMKPEQAKVTFLKYVYQWPTFGSAFFEVKVCVLIWKFRN